MAFIFTMRSGDDRRNRASTNNEPGDNHLSIIMENGDDAAAAAPPIPPRAANRPASRRFHIGRPPGHGQDVPPPPYSAYAGIIGPNGEKLNDVRNSKYIARRGGWRRLCLLLFIVIACLAGLIVGLVVGLRKHSSSSSSNSTPPASGPPPAATPTTVGPFPAGSYNIVTYLDDMTTNCTSNPNTWRCYPYYTYQDNPTGVATQFQWVINQTNGKDFAISTTANMFSFSFDNVPLSLVDKGQASERYHFSTMVNAVIAPIGQLTPDNAKALCYYNSTTFQADLYTKMAKLYPNSTSVGAVPSTPPGSSTAFQAWPYALSVELSISGGPDVPACYTIVNSLPGGLITNGFTAESSSSKCSCFYQNADTAPF